MNIDYQMMIADLNRWGLRDHKLTLICGFGTPAHVGRLRSGEVRDMLYPNAARLFNLWEHEAVLHNAVPRSVIVTPELPHAETLRVTLAYA